MTTSGIRLLGGGGVLGGLDCSSKSGVYLRDYQGFHAEMQRHAFRNAAGISYGEGHKKVEGEGRKEPEDKEE